MKGTFVYKLENYVQLNYLLILKKEYYRSFKISNSDL